jgi:hypothetical protein
MKKSSAQKKDGLHTYKRKKDSNTPLHQSVNMNRKISILENQMLYILKCDRLTERYCAAWTRS